MGRVGLAYKVPITHVYIPNGVVTNAVLRGKNGACGAGVKRRKDVGALGVSEFRPALSFATITCAVFGSVLLVSAVCVPAKISQSVVGWVAVLMAALHACGCWADERRKHKAMDVPFVNNAAHRQINGAVRSRSIGLGRKRGYGSYSTNIPHIGHFVKPLETKTGFPVLNNDCSISGSHIRSLKAGWSEPHGVLAPVRLV